METKFKIGDVVVPVTRGWDKRRYTVLDIFTSEKTSERLVQVGYIGNNGLPAISLTDERIFEPELKIQLGALKGNAE
jgi:hypothetical protein